MITLNTVAVEGSTLIATATFTDENGIPIMPASDVTWRVLDKSNNTITNGTETAAMSVDILITGITIDDSTRLKHDLFLIVETTYDGALGNGLPIKQVAKFKCTNIRDTP